MKFTLKPEETKQIKQAVEKNPVHQWLKIKDDFKFEVGDVLLKYHKQYKKDPDEKDVWIPENIKSDRKMPQRYVYVYEDEFGIGYVKQLRISNGTLGKELNCLSDFDLVNTRFGVDPEYAEHVLLDVEFDIKSIQRKSLEGRKIVTKMNRKIGIKPKTLKDYNDFFYSLSPGDKFWVSADYTGRYTREYTLNATKAVTVQTMDREHSWDWRRFKEKNPDAIGTTDVVLKISYTGAYGKETDRTPSSAFSNNVFYKDQAPAQEEDK